MFEVSRDLFKRLESVGVSVEKKPPNTVIFHNIQIDHRNFNRRISDIRFTYLDEEDFYIAYVDKGLRYRGSNIVLQILLSNNVVEGRWRVLSTPLATGESFEAVLVRTLSILGSPVNHAGEREIENIIETGMETGTATQALTGVDIIKQFGRDVTSLAEHGELLPVIGREAEIDRVQDILMKRIKNNPVLVGEAGVGKSAIVEGLAQRIVSGKVTSNLRSKRIIELSVGLLEASTGMRGELEARVKAILEATKKNPDIILFIDELQMLLGPANLAGLSDIGNMMKPALARGEVRMIGCVTPTDARRIKKDPALARRFVRVWVSEPSVQETISILAGLKRDFEDFHKCGLEPEIIEKAVTYSHRFLPQRRNPDKAIDLIDEVMASKRRRSFDSNDSSRSINAEQRLEITEGDLAGTIESMAGVPASKVKEDEREKLMEMGKALAKKVKGQDHAIKSVCDAIIQRRTEIGENQRPIANLLFVGPSGVGKTLLAKALAEYMFDDERALLRLDLSEFSEPHMAARLYGSPPGYVGYDEGGQLTEAIKKKPYSVVLLDEIEKAHPSVLNVLLQVLSDGRLTDSSGVTVSFSHSIIIMTSNLGTSYASKKAQLGFANALNAMQEDKTAKNHVSESLRKFFAPEFLGRLSTVYFNPLTEQVLKEILGCELRKLEERMGLYFKVSGACKKVLMSEGFSPDFGARQLETTILKRIQIPLSRKLLAGELETSQTVAVTLDSDNNKSFKFAKVVRQREREPKIVAQTT